MDKNTQQQLLRIVEQNYQAIAEEFNQTRKKALWPELVKLVETVPEGSSILDVGCGNGRLFEAFAGKKVDYLGVDNSTSLIELAKKNAAASDYGLRITNYEFLIANILELDKLAIIGQFNFIFCIAVLHHLPGEDLRLEALRQMEQKLKPGGKLILTNWNLWSQIKYLKIVLRFIILKLLGKTRLDFGDIVFDWKKGPTSQRYYHAFTGRELKRLAKKSGLKLEKQYKDKYNYYTILSK